MKAMKDEIPGLMEDFSLVQGGPLFQVLKGSRLCDDAMRWLARRLLFFFGVTWVPLLLLSTWEGHAWDGGLRIPFLLDVSTHTRLLVALPLLVAAELSVHQQLRALVRIFLDRGLVPDSSRGRFREAVDSAVRLRNSATAEFLLLALVYVVGVLFFWRRYSALEVPSWYGERVEGRLHPSWAGWWFGCVSLPLLQFLLLRWYFRLFIWLRFLWSVSRIDLRIVPTHPDRSGGLGFLSWLSYAFTPLLFAQGAMLSGEIAGRIFFEGAYLLDFKPEIVILLTVSLISVLGPTLVFSPRLARERRAGLIAYGTLAQHYVEEFDRKWVRGGAPAGEPLVGSADIQSLADLVGSYDALKEMRPLPFNLRTVLVLAVITLVPIAPLVLTMISFPELMQRLLQVVF